MHKGLWLENARAFDFFEHVLQVFQIWMGFKVCSIRQLIVFFHVQALKSFLPHIHKTNKDCYFEVGKYPLPYALLLVLMSLSHRTLMFLFPCLKGGYNWYPLFLWVYCLFYFFITTVHIFFFLNSDYLVRSSLHAGEQTMRHTCAELMREQQTTTHTLTNTLNTLSLMVHARMLQIRGLKALGNT
jgi:hypothetical protein